MTGAPLPQGADVVIKKEDVKVKNGFLIIKEELRENNNVIFKGSDMQNGELIVSKGDILSPYHIGALAALGIAEIKVNRCPKIAVISTGKELKTPGQEIKFGQIYNSNLFSIIALINKLGGEGRDFGCVDDDQDKIANVLLYALESNDIVITTGGVSVGDYDLVDKALNQLNAQILFSRISLKPGSPTMAAVKDGKLIIALSGNPAAALIGFELLVRPLIKKTLGIREYLMPRKKVQLIDGFAKKSPQRRFLRVEVAYEKDKWIARQTGNQQSGILRSMIGCNALVDIPAGSGPIIPGSLVDAVILD
jgi:molybdopterin molybdotransferase